MKRILAFLLVLVLALGTFASCDLVNKIKNKGEEEPTTTVTLDQAKAYLFNTYKDSAKEYKSDYDVVDKVIIDGVTFNVTWAASLESITIKKSNKANFWTVDLPDVNETAVDYTLTATITDADGNSVQVSFKKTLPVLNSVGVETMLKEGVAYKIFLDQVTAGNKYWAKATDEQDHKYVQTTLNPAEAAEYFVEVVDNGYKVYTTVDGTKLYLYAKTVDNNGKISKYIGLDATNASVFVYNDTISTFTVVIDGLTYGVGTYSTFTTISISDISYFKADNINVAGGQFPMTFMTAEEANKLQAGTEPTPPDPTPVEGLDIITAPLTGVAYKLGLFHGNENANVFFHGGIYNANQPWYLGYSAELTDAVDVYLEAVEGVDGGFRLYFMNGEAKTYIRMYPRDGDTTKGTMELTTTVPTECFTFNSEYNTLVYTSTTGEQFYMGSSGTYKSISTSAITYISQATSYPVHLYGENHTHDYTSVTTDPTCVTAGKTVYTCNCGHTYEEAGDPATGVHNYVEGVCSACGATEGHVHDWVAGTVVAPTCTTAGYTPYTCTGCTETKQEPGEPATDHSWDNGVYTDPTCTAAGFTTYTCGNCQTTNKVTNEEDPATGHADNTGDYKCDACGAAVLPADGTALTITEALAVAKAAGSSYSTQKYYITGIVTNVYNTTYGNLYLKDADGNEICIYGLYTWDKAVRYDKMEYKPVEGDELTVYTVLGTYNSTAQGKDAWIDEVVAHTHNYVDVVTEPTCTAEGYTTHTCSICKDSKVDTTVDALGHTVTEGECERCGKTVGAGAPTEPETLVKFNFGANSSAAHVDGQGYGTSKSFTEGTHTLTLTGMEKVYGPSYDAKGNSCIKLGTSSVVGKFSFTVDENVTKVIIYVAQYKSNTTKITVNGTAYTITTASNNGAYTPIEIDTTENKTVTFATVSGGVRCMIDAIELVGYAE